MRRAYDDLVQEAAGVSVDGWDFSWLDGRATEERPSWGYARLLGERLATVGSALDIQTGGGEILAGVPTLPPVTVATESWPPNLKLAASRLRPRGAWVVADDEEPRLPFASGAFKFVASRHPVETWWEEIARVLRPGGSYLSQQVGPRSVYELAEFFLGPLHGSARDPAEAEREAEAAGLEVVDLRSERLRMEFRDIGAVVYFLRKVIWIVPGFSVERYEDRLRALHDRIESEGPFVAHSARFLIEARKPDGPTA
ncbi:class I SAM-dependent methyltransferase [Nonomuraea sp. KC401]|uniref:class I SAM-dependent methyltransferase n=1 Tax=unclassified Nonomuraea TaxID=2593643 RepID=UPI0010FD4A54|nr:MULTISPECIES: class I SAM-dependent methyltransferase [unclassified Nonomuraea]NBE96682.1 methyltransferase domain-containing protein [Nonomuraea sp. K271]TLF67956.1 class I SAM-dependent methyltransferase [Nonomuraea sp. KC401]